MASMPGCSVNNTLMIGTESVAAMIATGSAAGSGCVWVYVWRGGECLKEEEMKLLMLLMLMGGIG